MKEKKFDVCIEYADGTGFNFQVTLNGSMAEAVGDILMITRGTLKASRASRATAYDEKGHQIVSYY